MQTARLLAFLAAVLLALLCVRTAYAAAADTAPPSAADAGAPASSVAVATPADGGAPAPAPGPDPTLRLPPTAAEQAEGLPIAAIEVVLPAREAGHLFKVENLTATSAPCGTRASSRTSRSI
jgi:hypothetical protein